MDDGRMARRRPVTKIFVVTGVLLIAVAWPFLASAGAKQAQGRSPSGTASQLKRELQRLGEKAAKAVLDKDIPALLSYDRADLRAADEVSLNNTKSDLYCFLFDSSCITWGDGNWVSVYEKLSQARQLQVRVKLSKSASDWQLYGSVLFYDAAAISEQDLRSQDFLCKEAPGQIASWRFRREAGKWKAVTPLFDSETESLCPH